MKKTEIISTSPDETFEIARKLSIELKEPILIGLNGELGSGKTVFAKGFAEGLGVKELINSPTFLGVSESYSGRLPFIHMDFYMKVVPEEKINAYLQKGSVVLIEWINNFKSVFNKELNPDISVYIQYLNGTDGNIIENKRKIVLCYTV